MTAQTPRNRRLWSILAVVLLVAVGAWWLVGGNGGEAGRTPTTPAPAPSAAASTTERTQPPSTATSTAPTGRTQTSRAPTGRTQTTHPATVDPVSGLPFVEVADLPKEAVRTLELIDSGGPFPYEKDGSTFGNFERILPQERRGFYREYTVDTPGSRNRGARRIVTGDNDRIHYWTDDHYVTFKRIRR